MEGSGQELPSLPFVSQLSGRRSGHPSSVGRKPKYHCWMPSLDTFRPEKGRVVTRSDVPSRYKWDLTAICRTADEWQAAYRELDASIDAFKQFQGTLKQGASRLL